MFRIIVISFPETIPDETLLVNALFDNGMESFHLRKPGMSYSEMKKYLKRIPTPWHERITLHSNYRLAEESGLRGIHLTTASRHEYPHWALSGKTISLSLHSLAELNQVKEHIRYAFLSPVFNSISKNGYPSNFNRTELKKALQQKRPFDIIALGGIEPDHIPELQSLGFNGAALLGAIWMPFLSGMSVKYCTELFNKTLEACKLLNPC